MKAFSAWLNQSDKHKGWSIGLIAVVVLSAGLGLRDPWPPDEPALALMAQDMADSGEWLIPYLADKPFSGHPPFAIWLQAALYDVLNSMRLSFLLPALLASLGTLWLVYDLGKKLWGPRTGRLAAMALLCSLQFMIQAHRGHVDAMLMFWSTFALYCLLQYMLLENTRRWLSLAGVAMGFGVLTKGIGYLPALILLPYFWMYRNNWQGLPRGRQLEAFWLVAAGCLIVVFAWALPALGFVSGADDGALDEFRRRLLLNLSGVNELLDFSDTRPWWYLFGQALILWLPLSLMLPWKFRIWRNRLKAKDAFIGLLLAYVLACLLLFSLLPGKHGVQLLILLPAVALLMAPYLGGLWWRPGVQRLSVIALWAVSACLFMVGLVGHKPELWPQLLDQQLDVPVFLWNFAFGLGSLGLLVSLVLRGRSRAMGLPVYFFLAWVVIGYWAYPSLNDLRTPRAVYQQAETYLGTDDVLASWDWTPRLALFRGQRTLIRSESEQEALAWVVQSPKHWLLVDASELSGIIGPEAEGWTIHKLLRRHRRDWVLAQPKSSAN